MIHRRAHHYHCNHLFHLSEFRRQRIVTVFINQLSAIKSTISDYFFTQLINLIYLEWRSVYQLFYLHVTYCKERTSLLLSGDLREDVGT